MAGAAGLRRWACQNGWRIADEALAEEPQHLYEIILLEHGEEAAHSDLEYEIGPRLLEKRPLLLAKHLAKLQNAYKHTLDSMAKSAQAQQSEKYKKLQELYAGLEELRHECGCK